MCARLLAVLALVLPSLAWAQHSEAFIHEGDFLGAYAVASEEEGVTALVWAAQAASLHATYLATDDAEKVAWLERAVVAAERALSLAPEAAGAHFELARATGLLAHHQGVMENLGTAGTLRALLERTLELDPQHADAKVALARWHFELTERGVGWLFGARRELVGAHLNEALAQEPERINFRNEAALILISTGRVEEAREQLRLALSLPARSAVDRLEQARAQQMLDELVAGGP